MKVILVDIDTLRPDRLGCYGHTAPTSPNLDRLAGRGLRFTQAYAVDTPCVPSRASLFAGRFGACHGAIDFADQSQFYRPTPLNGRGNGQRIMDELPLPSALFKQRIRCATVSTFGRHPAAFFFPGWDEVIAPHEPDGPEYPDLFSDEQQACHDSVFNPQYEGMQTVRGEKVVDTTLDWIERNRDDDFFLHVHLWDPHTPYMAPAEDVALFTDTLGTPDLSDEQLARVVPGRFRDRAAWRKVLQYYDAEIHYADRQLGRLFERVEALGLDDETVFIVTSDHGEDFGEKGMVAEHGSVYQGTARIPLIIAGVGITPGVSGQLTANIDLAPTIIGLFGRPAPAGWQGMDLAPLLQGEDRPLREHLLLSHAVYGRQRALIAGEYKLVRTYQPFRNLQRPGMELYNLADDPYEQQDLLLDEPAVAVKLSQTLDETVTKLLDGRPDPLLARYGQSTWLHQAQVRRRGYP